MRGALVTAGAPDLVDDAPIAVTCARRLLGGGAPHIHHMASLARLSTGRLVLTFSRIVGTRRRNNGALMASRSDDDGVSWTPPDALYAVPGWDCLNLGGLTPFSDARLLLALGRLQTDPMLPDGESCTGWRLTTTTSADGGETWAPGGPEVRLFPAWTEFYGASNPHRLADGRHMLAVIGTTGRDSGWQAGVCFTEDQGATFSPPVIVAAHPTLGFGDMDAARLDDGRFLAVARVFGGHPSVCSVSNDEGRTWSEPRPLEFCGANVKLQRLRGGQLLCAYRDERGGGAGVACSVSEDAGATWRRLGWLARPPDGAPPAAFMVRCGYPDMAPLRSGLLGCVLAPAPDADGTVDLRWLELEDRT